MNKIITLLFTIIVITVNNFVYSQNKNNSPIDLSLEISSKYMWRGIEYGTAPTIFPTIAFSKGGFSIFGTGAYAFDGSHQEIDLGINYSYNGFTIGISDYFYPSAVGDYDKYFNFNNKTTGHLLEGYLTIAPFKVPIWLTASTFFYGADKNNNDEQAYSSYLEVGYDHYFNEKDILTVTVGANLNKSFYTDYEGNFNIVNVIIKYTRNLQIKNFTLPVSASYIINPYKEKSFFTFSTYLKF